MFLRNALLTMTLIVSLVPLTAPAKDDHATYEMSAEGELQITPDGQVSDFHLRNKLAPVIANQVDRAVRRWHFEPIIINGSPVIAKTAVHIGLKAEPIADKDEYTVRFTGIRFGEPTRTGSMKAPHYPKEAMHARIGAKVMLALRLDEAGKVIEVQAYQTSLDQNDISDANAARYRRLIEEATLDAAKDWQFDLSERIDGKPLGTKAMIPVEYAVCAAPCRSPNGKWRAYFPGPVHPVPWVHDGQLADSLDPSSLEDGQAMALDSRFRLKDNVVGKTL